MLINRFYVPWWVQELSSGEAVIYLPEKHLLVESYHHYMHSRRWRLYKKRSDEIKKERWQENPK